MKKILKLNAISPIADEEFTTDYELLDACDDPQGIMVRSYDMHSYDLPESVIAVARAGAGTNNIPTVEYAQKGVVVFNTPGANANAVKELVLAGILLGSRKIVDGIKWIDTLKGNGDAIAKMVEKGKKNFVGPEIYGKTLGVIGLGAIGIKVANDAYALGMKVVGYDPYLSVENALKINNGVKKVNTLDELLAVCDYLTVHVPLLKDNAGFINKDFIAKMKDGVVIINCARGELVNNADMIDAIKSGKVARHVTDFACEDFIGVENIVMTPHLGASTPEAEDNCAVMAARQLVDYIDNGNIVNSVNMPNCSAPRVNAVRITVCHLNIANMIAQLTSVFAKDGVNIENLVNKSKGDFAYTIIDTDSTVSEKVLQDLRAIDGIIKVRLI